MSTKLTHRRETMRGMDERERALKRKAATYHRAKDALEEEIAAARVHTEEHPALSLRRIGELTGYSHSGVQRVVDRVDSNLGKASAPPG